MDLISILFIFLWLLLPIVWYAMLKIAALEIYRATLPIFVIISIFVYQYIGLPYLYFGLDEYRAQFVHDKYLILQVWIMTSMTITSMIIGFILARYGLGRLTFFRHIEFSIQPLKSLGQFKLMLLGSLSVLVLYQYLTIIGLKNTALSVALGFNDDLSRSLARSLMGNDFPGSYHWYRLFMRDILFFVFISLYAHYLVYRGKLTFLLLVFFGLNLTLSLLMATEKGPIANFLITILLTTAWVKNQGFLNFIKLAKYALFLISLSVLSYIYFMDVADPIVALSSVFSRTFTGQIQPAYHYLEFFPAHQDWLYGRSFPNPAGIFPFEPYRLTFEVMNFVNLHTDSRVVGSMPTIYWGELYANFGYIGALLIPIFIGLLLYIINYIVFFMKFKPVVIAFFIWLMMHYQSLSTTGLSSFIIDIPLFVFLIILIILSLRIRYKNSRFS